MCTPTFVHVCFENYRKYIVRYIYVQKRFYFIWRSRGARNMFRRKRFEY